MEIHSTLSGPMNRFGNAAFRGGPLPVSFNIECISSNGEVCYPMLYENSVEYYHMAFFTRFI
jgi:hypothetical protein